MAKEVEGSRENLPFLGSDVYIFRPEMSPNKYWVSYKPAPGVKRRYESLKTSDKAEAFSLADNHVEEKKARYKRAGVAGLNTSPTLKACWAHWEKFNNTPGYCKSDGRRRIISSHWKRFVLPYFGEDCEVSNTSPTATQLAGYTEFRRKLYKTSTGRKPSMGKSTHVLEALSFHQVLNKAKQAGIITDFPKMKTDPQTQRVRRRSASVEFEFGEIPTLIRNFEHYCSEEIGNHIRPYNPDGNGTMETLQGVGVNPLHHIARERMYAFAMIVLATSARPSSVSHLKWKDVVSRKQDEKRMYQFNFSHSKIGLPYKSIAWGFGIDIGEVLGRWEQFAPSRKRRDHLNERIFDISYRDKKGILFGGYSEKFHDFLKQYDMLIHPDKSFRRKHRATYSLRVTAIRHRANSGFPVNLVADQANNSAAEIDRSYYSATTKTAMEMFSKVDDMRDAEVISIKKNNN